MSEVMIRGMEMPKACWGMPIENTFISTVVVYAKQQGYKQER